MKSTRPACGGKLACPTVALRAAPPPRGSGEWIGPGTQGESGGQGWGWAAGRGSPTSLPGSGLTQVRSGPEGWNQVTSPPGGQLKTRDRGPALSCFGHAEQSVNHEDRDSTALIHLLREAGRAAHLFPLFPHPSLRLAMDPPRYTLRGGASLSELWAGRGLLVAALDFAPSPGGPPVPGDGGAAALSRLPLR